MLLHRPGAPRTLRLCVHPRGCRPLGWMWCALPANPVDRSQRGALLRLPVACSRPRGPFRPCRPAKRGCSCWSSCQTVRRPRGRPSPLCVRSSSLPSPRPQGTVRVLFATSRKRLRRTLLLMMMMMMMMMMTTRTKTRMRIVTMTIAKPRTRRRKRMPRKTMTTATPAAAPAAIPRPPPASTATAAAAAAAAATFSRRRSGRGRRPPHRSGSGREPIRAGAGAAPTTARSRASRDAPPGLGRQQWLSTVRLRRRPQCRPPLLRSCLASADAVRPLSSVAATTAALVAAATLGPRKALQGVAAVAAAVFAAPRLRFQGAVVLPMNTWIKFCVHMPCILRLPCNAWLHPSIPLRSEASAQSIRTFGLPHGRARAPGDLAGPGPPVGERLALLGRRRSRSR